MEIFTLKKFYLIAITLFLFLYGSSYGQTPYNMASGNYSENFDDIATITAWPDGFNGTSSTEWRGLAINTTGTVPDGIKITATTTAAFVSGYNGGVQRGDGTNGPTGSVVLLATGSTDLSSSVGIELYLDFTSRIAGTLSFSWASVNNQTGNRSASLRVYTSIDGITYTELTGAQALNFTNNTPTSGTISSVVLPTAFNGASNARIRFYDYNGTGGTTGSRPKISIDNVAVTSTAIHLPIVSAATQTTNNNAQTITAQSSLATGKVYIILNGVTQVTAADLDAAVAANRGASAAVVTANTDVAISTTGLVGGTYYAYAVDGSGTVSVKGTNAITITDVTIPAVTAAVQSTTNAPGQIVTVQSSEADGQVYIIKSDVTPQATVADFTAAINASKGAVASVTLANTNVSVSTNGLLPGTYYAYAVDGAGNVSPKGTNPITITAPAVLVTAAAQNVTNLAGQTVNVQSSQAGTLYIIRQEVAQVTVADLDAASAATALDGAKVTTVGNVLESVSTSGLRGGTYYAYAVDNFSNISAKSVNAITIKTVVTAAAQTVGNIAGQTVAVQSSVASGKVYIVLSSVARATQANLDAAVVALNGASATVSSANSNVAISTSGLANGTYYAYAADGGTTISDAGTNAITIKDATPPTVSAGIQAITNLGQVARVQSSKASGFVYIMMSGIAADTTSFTAAIAAMKGAKTAVSAANTDITVSGKGLLIGTYYAYAVDASGNVSSKSTNAITISGTTGTANLESGVTTIYVSNHNLMIDVTVRLSDKANAEVYDMYGRKLAVYGLNEGSNVFSPAWKGMFIVRVYNGSEIITRKLYLF
jgi:hypothetical protein